MVLLKVVIFVLLINVCFSVEVPAGLRPAKAVGETEAPKDTIVPEGDKVEEENPIAPPNVRTPPNISLRSRHVAAQNSAASHDEQAEEAQSAFKEPVVFTKKSAKKPEKEKQKAPIKVVEVPASSTNVPRVTGPPPPSGNYGVNTILQTNLVDSQGHIIRGVNSVPIRVPSADELKNAKTNRASAHQVETDAEKVVPIEFGGQRRF